MLRHLGEQVEIMEEERKISNLLATIRKPLAVKRVDAFGKAIMRTEMPQDRTAAGRNDGIDHSLWVSRDLLGNFAADIKTEFVDRGCIRVAVDEAKAATSFTGDSLLVLRHSINVLAESLTRSGAPRCSNTAILVSVNSIIFTSIFSLLGLGGRRSRSDHGCHVGDKRN